MDVSDSWVVVTKVGVQQVVGLNVKPCERRNSIRKVFTCQEQAATSFRDDACQSIEI